MKKGLKIHGVGYYVPPKVVTNDDIAKIVDTNDEWIRTRSGIRERHFAEEGVMNADMAEAAAKKAIESVVTFRGETSVKDFDVSEIGLVLVGTFTPDCYSPSVASALQGRLGLPSHTMVMDISGGCTGYLLALKTAHALLQTLDCKYALVIGSELIYPRLDWNDRSSCILFGDGAGASIVSLSEDDELVFEDSIAHKGDEKVIHVDTLGEDAGLIRIEGQAVYKFAVSNVPGIIQEAMDKAGWTPEDIDLYILHQANVRIIQGVAKHFGQPMDKFFVNADKYANTSAASIAIAMADATEQGLLKPGMKVLLSGFGAGLIYGAICMEI